MATNAVLRVRHARYGRGWWQRLLEPGHVSITFDCDNGVERRVLIRDLAPETVRESAADVDRSINDTMGRDVRAVTRCLREVRS
jgi:hypothetical protein